MKLKFKSLDEAKLVGERMKGSVQYTNFRSKSVKLEERSESNGVIKITGYASTKDRDRYGDIVQPSAFQKTMSEFMKNPILLKGHKMDQQIWVITDYEIDDNGLKIAADIKYNAWDPELFDKVMNWDLKGFSIGFRILDLEFVEHEDEKGNEMWTLHILDLELLEISLVEIPANPYTLAKSINDLMEKSFEEFKASQTKSEDGDGDPWKWEDPDEPDGTPNNPQTKELENEPNKAPDEPEEPTPEKSEIDNEGKDDTIEITKSDEAENPTETAGSDNAGEEEKEKAGYTLQVLEKLAKGIAEASKKELQKDFEEKLKTISQAHEKQIQELEKSFEEALGWILDIARGNSKSISELAKGIQAMHSWKWMIYTEDHTEKPQGWGREKSILQKLAEAKSNV